MCSLEDENKDLRYEIGQQLGIIEAQKQELHNAHRQIECLNLMKVEMEIEIEALTGLHKINGNLETKVKHLETELDSARLKCESLETELRDEKDSHEKVVSELNLKIMNLNNEKDENKFSEEQTLLQSKLNSLQESNSFLSSHNNELQNENKNLNEKAVILQLSINEKNDELQEMKSILESRSNDLKSALKLVEELQEEKSAISAELMALKCHPVTAGDERGNSLFAEVDNKRQSVTHKLEVMHKKYKELKKSFIKKNTELRALEAENIELRKQWKEDENAPYESMASLLESHKNRIQDLTYTISILEKRPENPQIISVTEVTDANFNCVKTLVDNERQVNRDLLKEMEQRSIRELSQGEEVFQLKQKVRSLTAKSMKDAATISELTYKLESKLQV